jgi:hypothetical protein
MAVLVTKEEDLDKLTTVFPPGSLPPALDASQLDDKAFLAIFGGTQSSSGYSVDLVDTTVAGDEVLLDVAVSGPPAGRLVEPASHVPYKVLALDRASLPADVDRVVLELQEEPQVDAPPASPSAYETLDSGSLLGTEPLEPLAVVVTGEDELDRLYDLFPPSATPPQIDAARLAGDEAIIAIFGGLQGSSGYTVALKDIKSEGNQVTLEVEISRPPAKQLVEPAEQIPYSIVQVSRSRLPAEIENVVLSVSQD